MRYAIWTGAVVVCCLAWPAPGRAADQPRTLAETDLFKTAVHGCEPVPLAAWHHPVRRFLDQPGIHLLKVELCNDRHFPIFYVDLQYDPMAHTDSFFLPLYANMADANGNWPFAMVSLKDGEVVQVTPKKGTHEVSVTYDTFGP